MELCEVFQKKKQDRDVIEGECTIWPSHFQSIHVTQIQESVLEFRLSGYFNGLKLAFRNAFRIKVFPASGVWGLVARPGYPDPHACTECGQLPRTCGHSWFSIAVTLVWRVYSCCSQTVQAGVAVTLVWGDGGFRVVAANCTGTEADVAISLVCSDGADWRDWHGGDSKHSGPLKRPTVQGIKDHHIFLR